MDDESMKSPEKIAKYIDIIGYYISPKVGGMEILRAALGHFYMVEVSKGSISPELDAYKKEFCKEMDSLLEKYIRDEEMFQKAIEIPKKGMK